MTVVLARIDQRLVHGIIVNQWGKVLNIKRYMVIDDAVSKDETAKAGMRMSKPMGTGMSIINTETAINNFKSGKYDMQRVLILVKEPQTILKLIDAGIDIPKVDLGIVFNEGDREAITKFVALNKQEKLDIEKIKKKHVPVVIQYVPTDSEQDINF